MTGRVITKTLLITTQKSRKMKKLRFFNMVCVLAMAISSITGCDKNKNGNGNNDGNGWSGGGCGSVAGYVDMGLPSGTKWKSTNETGGYNGFYTYDEAVSAFGDKLPTKEQLEELKVYCTWEWQVNGGYKVTGQNGNSIVLPAAGFRDCNGDVYVVGFCGYYWSSTPYGSDYAWFLCFNSDKVDMSDYSRCEGQSVRLVQD